MTKVGHLKRIQQGIKDIHSRMSTLDKSATVLWQQASDLGDATSSTDMLYWPIHSKDIHSRMSTLDKSATVSWQQTSELCDVDMLYWIIHAKNIHSHLSTLYKLATISWQKASKLRTQRTPQTCSIDSFTLNPAILRSSYRNGHLDV